MDDGVLRVISGYSLELRVASGGHIPGPVLDIDVGG